MHEDIIHGSVLRLGDVVSLFLGDPYDDATVKNLTADTVTLFRPYVMTPDWTHTGGVTCYIGIEEFTCARNTTFRLRQRKSPAL